jgi:4-amino-4-deoxy-L-arabinose transferase-like glycosyltransferase
MTMTDAPVRNAAVPRWIVRVGLAVSVAMLLVNLVKLIHFAWFALHYPYDLDYAEGIVWQQMRNIVAGIGYRPIGVYPSIVYHYPPVYHLATAVFAMAGGLDQLVAGRLLSLLSTIGIMILTGALAAATIPASQGRFVRIGAGAIAALSLASTSEIAKWAPMMRVDMLATALTLGGLLLAIHAARRPWLIALSAVAFVLALYTKQIMIAAPAAAFAGLLLIRPRVAGALAAFCLALGSAALAMLTLQTHGGFLQHIIVYNINRTELGQTGALVHHLKGEIIFLAMAIVAVQAGWRRLRPEDGGSWRQRLNGDAANPALLIALIYLALKLMMLPMFLKSGAADNYLIEWVCAAAIFVGAAMVPVLAFVRDGDTPVPLVLLALVVLGVPIATLRVIDVTPDAALVPRETAAMAALVARIRSAPKPVISDDMILLIRAGKPVMWEPAIEAELASQHRYDERAFAQMVRRGDFAFFLTRGIRGSKPFDERYDAVVADAMDAAYPRLLPVADVTLHLPAN